MALFRCSQYPYLLVLDPREPQRELARFKDGYFQSNDPFTIAELSKRPYIERIDGDADEKHATYRVEYRKCGRKNCRCARGELHGPYLYALYREHGKTKRKYVGKS